MAYEAPVFDRFYCSLPNLYLLADRKATNVLVPVEWDKNLGLYNRSTRTELCVPHVGLEYSCNSTTITCSHLDTFQNAPNPKQVGLNLHFCVLELTVIDTEATGARVLLNSVSMNKAVDS